MNIEDFNPFGYGKSLLDVNQVNPPPYPQSPWNARYAQIGSGANRVEQWNCCRKRAPANPWAAGSPSLRTDHQGKPSPPRCWKYFTELSECVCSVLRTWCSRRSGCAPGWPSIPPTWSGCPSCSGGGSCSGWSRDATLLGSSQHQQLLHTFLDGKDKQSCVRF